MNDPWILTAPVEVIPGSDRQTSSEKDRNVRRVETHESSQNRSHFNEESSSSYGTAVATSSNRRRSSRRRSSDSTSCLLRTTERWHWNVMQVKPLPPYYKVERTALRVCGSQPATISKRISNFLRIHSISASYHDDHGECITSGRCKFVVNLWEGDTAKDEIIIEAQRRSGCLLQMRRIRFSLYQHISKKDGKESPHHDNDQEDLRVLQSSPLTFRFRAHHAAAGKPSRGKSKSEACTTCTLDRAQRMLESAHVDQHELGLECLASLVDTTMSGEDCALDIAEAIVCGTGKHADRLRPLFGDFFHETSLEEDKELYDDESIGSDHTVVNQYARGYQFGVLHSLALQVLANCLERIMEVHESEPGKVYQLDIRSWMWRNIIHSLVYNVEVAEYRPQEAALSTKCLSLILKLAPDVQHCRCIEERLIPGLVYAHRFGQAHSMKLEIESISLMSILY